ncbi:AraC-like protein [Tamaricihabitans halophyticus]|uniref:AraC-like protein n=1 Tax=Tamaricihabitans halophyticus TaxID=1262583 RepID=A0A4R2Q941_9PSEU|nr:cupin domain-containing protein [Tamaricihabitans halophyticus]TCP45099.1 AraC-like protein [Tamaricihabitans halophyticus]
MTVRGDVVVVSTLAGELLAEARENPAGRAARTVVSGTSQRATVIALIAGAELSEHQAPAAATIQVIAGQVWLYTAAREWRLTEGDLVAVPPERHGVRAEDDAAVLLTVALR